MNWFNQSRSRGDARITIASDWAPIWTYQALMEHNPLAVYGDLLPLLRESDLNIVNVECVLGTRGSPAPKAGPALQGNPAAIPALTAVPFHLATLSNNHSMDYGPESLIETLENLKAAGVQTVGAGRDGREAAAPWRGRVGAAQVGVINCSEAEACASLYDSAGAYVYEAEAARRQIGELRQQCDIVLVIFHGGREHAPIPPPYMLSALRQMAEAGAHAVIAHHPHVPQGMEIHRGVPIAYSQGNFVFRRGEEQYYLNAGYLVHLDIAGRILSGVSFTPYRMEAEGVFRLKGSEEREFRHYLEITSALLSDPKAVEQAWHGFVDECMPNAERVLLQLERSILESHEKGLSGYARLHHYFFCPAHRHLFQTAFARLARGRCHDSPEWARQLVKAIRMRRVGDPPSPFPFPAALLSNRESLS